MLNRWQQLRQRYPEIMSTCITNDWLLQSIRAQKKFSRFYEFIGTNTLIIAADADKDLFVFNRAMQIFVNKAPRVSMFVAPNSYHEVLFENEIIRGAAMKVICDFFTQVSDNVELVVPCSPLILFDKNTPIYSPAETVIRAVGISIGIVTCSIGIALLISGGRIE